MLERLAQLESNVNRLEAIERDYKPDDLSSSNLLEWAVRYGLIESIQIVIDTACGLCNKNNLGSPRNYEDCLRLLQEFKYLPPELAGTLIRIVGLRNLLIHEYVAIDNARLYGFLSELSVFRDYAKAIHQFL
ncbi:MAG: hypothetical protein A3J97_01725 [Spirochaetes bacterium RIFOXYC1_FULL_54_7]|nr:MAG: hypothetical protein A3J97_01725 [Spirochaetes bacterium RIFOXYC1_FULL_54_7]